jgi:hypothetical protein
MNQKRWRSFSLSTWYQRKLGRWSGMLGRRGAPELQLAPVSSVEETRERERMSGRLGGAV